MMNIFLYERTSKVSEPGQFRISGSIIDIFPISSHKPIRINFFGDGIENIKYFSTATQRSEAEIKEAMICSEGIYMIGNENINFYKKGIDNYFTQEYIEDIEYEMIVN